MLIRLLCVAAIALASCKKSDSEVKAPPTVRQRIEQEQSAAGRSPPLGVLRLSGNVHELRASPDGAMLTVLVDAKTPSGAGIPPTLKVGTLWAVPTTGGTPKKIAAGVSNGPGGWLYSNHSQWLVVSSSWSPGDQLGELLLVDIGDLSKEPRSLGKGVSYFVPSDDGSKLAWIEGGVLHVGSLPGGPFRDVAAEASTAEFSPDGRFLYFKRRVSAAGGLYQIDLNAAKPSPRRLADHVADFQVLKSGHAVVLTARDNPADRTFQLMAYDVTADKIRKLSDDASRFRISHDESTVAWRGSLVQGDQTDVGQLWIASLKSGQPRQLGKTVKDFEFSPDGLRLVYRDNFVELPLGGRDARPGEARIEKVGDLYSVDLKGGAPQLIAKRSPNFLFSPNGALALTARIETPDVTRRLLILRPNSLKAEAIQDWLYEYQFRPTANSLYFRANCTREGRSCALMKVNIETEKELTAAKVAEGVFGVRFSADGSKMVTASAHFTDSSFDLFAQNADSGAATPIDQFVEWPALLVGPTGEHVAYLVHEASRPGVYVAKMPAR